MSAGIYAMELQPDGPDKSVSNTSSGILYVIVFCSLFLDRITISTVLRPLQCYVSVFPVVVA